MRLKQTNRRGFTIIELLLVTILIVLLIGAAGGFYRKTYKKALVKKSARDLLLAAKYAKILAIERQSKCLLKLDTNDNGFMLNIETVDIKTEEMQQVIVRDLYVKPMKFADSVKFEDIRIKVSDPQLMEEQQQTITFQPDGSAQEAIVQIGDGENHFTVYICGMNGKAKMYSNSAENIKSDTIDLDRELM